eukprot:7390540-Prymnesium_polylepis.5
MFGSIISGLGHAQTRLCSVVPATGVAAHPDPSIRVEPQTPHCCLFKNPPFQTPQSRYSSPQRLVVTLKAVGDAREVLSQPSSGVKLMLRITSCAARAKWNREPLQACWRNELIVMSNRDVQFSMTLNVSRSSPSLMRMQPAPPSSVPSCEMACEMRL